MSLPCEMLDEILCRLPVKFLLRYRCVSKEWCSLIDSDAFVKKHFRKAIECKTDGVIIDGDGKFFLTDSESLYDDNAAVIELNDAFLSGAEFVGVANGLVCFSKNNKNEFVVFNPSTRKYKKIPSPPREFARELYVVDVSLCGFGYDHVNDDYKVVQILGCYSLSRGRMAIVYSLKTNSWTRIQDVPSGIRFNPERGKFAGGALYWLVIRNSVQFSPFIVGFDLGLEKFKEVPFPAVGGSSVCLFPVGGALCFLDNYTNSRTDVWLMNNYGAENPWYKAFSVEQPGVCGSFRFLIPVAVSRTGKDVLFNVDNKKLMWYDPQRKAVKNVRIHGIPIVFFSHLYTESLLQLTKDEQLQKPSQDKKEKKQQKKREDFLSKGFKLKL